MSEKLTDDDLQAMLDRCDSATPGPWHNVGGYSCMKQLDDLRCEEVFRTLAPGEDVANPDEHETRWKEDCEFLVHARTDLPRVIRELQAAREREAAKDAVIEAARKLAEWAMEWADETDLGELHGGLINAVRALPQARVVFLAGAAWGGEEAAKIADKYPGVYGNSPTAAAIRAHFRDIRKHYDLTEGEPEVDPK